STISYPNTRVLSSSLTVGISGNYDETERFRIRGQQLPSAQVINFDQAEVLIGGNTSLPTDVYTAIASIGIFVQEQLTFFDRLTITAGLRGDGNSAFGSDYGFQINPKVSTALVVSENPVWSSKLRAAWGRSAKAPKPFSSEATYNLSRSNITGQP